MTDQTQINVTLEDGPFDGYAFPLDPQITRLELSQVEDAEQYVYRRLEWSTDPLADAVFKYQTLEQEAERDDRYGL